MTALVTCVCKGTAKRLFGFGMILVRLSKALRVKARDTGCLELGKPVIPMSGAAPCRRNGGHPVNLATDRCGTPCAAVVPPLKHRPRLRSNAVIRGAVAGPRCVCRALVPRSRTAAEAASFAASGPVAPVSSWLQASSRPGLLVAVRIDTVRHFRIEVVGFRGVFPRFHRLLHPKWS